MNTEFNKLSIDKQVQFINTELEKDKNISVTKLCKKFGLNKSTIISRFTKDDYKYSVAAREYIKDTKVIQNDNKSINKDIIQNNSKSISTNKIVENNDLMEMQELKGRLTDLKGQLKEIIQHYNKSKNIVDVPKPIELKIDKDKFHGELKGRFIKVYQNVNDYWIKFCKNNSQFKMQDLYSIALLEFMEKYKK